MCTLGRDSAVSDVSMWSRCSARCLLTLDELDETVIQVASILSASSVALNHAVVTARLLNSLIVCDAAEFDFAMLTDTIRASIHPPSDVIEREALSVFATAAMIQSGQDLPENSAYAPEVAAFVEAVAGMGKACTIPGSWQGAMLAVLTSRSFVDGIRKNIVAGGCNCSRANVAGACMGAIYGIGGDKGIPIDWIEKTDQGIEAFSLALRFVA